MGEATFDYIVIGAGSAGCVVTARLAEAGATVAAIEAGGKDNSPFIAIPGLLPPIVYEPWFNWCFNTEPEPNLNNRRLFTPRGKVVGGTGSINGMVYIRGNKRDYDYWRQLGCDGWSYNDVLPYFKKSEGHENGESTYHGGDGPLKVSVPKHQHTIYDRFFEAVKAAGYPMSDDFNGEVQDGAGRYHSTYSGARRYSTARAFLHPSLKTKRVELYKKAHAKRIVFDGKKAVGVEFYRPDGSVETVRAKREVIVAGGAIGSPHLLLASGVGPAEQLQAHGVEVVHNAPSVGENLLDHLHSFLIVETTKPVSMLSDIKFPKNIFHLANVAVRRKGLLSEFIMSAGGFFKTRPELDVPDVQVHLAPGWGLDHGRKMMDRHGFQLQAAILRPESKGTVRLKSADTRDHPAIQPNHLATENDRRTLRDGTKLLRTIVSQSSFDDIRGPEIMPGNDIKSDQELDDAIRGNAESEYHLVGTCRMGSDEKAVLDPTLKVNGVEGLRVIDASVMPAHIGGNTNAAAIMIGEKGADLLVKGC